MKRHTDFVRRLWNSVKRNIRAFEKRWGLHFTLGHTGKMTDVWSLSTSVVLNQICQARAKVPGSICAHCYAMHMVGKMYKNLAKNLADNTRVLTETVIPVMEWPDLEGREIFRLEAFGDLNNSIQVRNYFNFARRNPGTTFALWTKNPQLIAVAIKDGHEKPENLIVIQSSCHVNKEDAIQYDFVEKLFTVYAPDYIEEHGVAINCGARNCNKCRRCYKHTTSVERVNEKLK